jgi:hypothetical protein
MSQAEGYGGAAVNTKYSAAVEQALKKAAASSANNNPAPTLLKTGGGKPVEPAVITNKTIAKDVNGNLYYTNVSPSSGGGGNVISSNPVTSVEVVTPVTNADIVTGASSSSSSSRRSSPRRPKLRSGESMADLLGIRYDQDYIAGLMSDAVAKQYANLDAEYGRTQDLYYDAVAGNADMLLQTLRRGDRDAVMSGLGSGTQAATELSGVLGVSKDNAQGATELAQGRSDLVFDREAALAKVKVDALKYYNDLGLNLGALSNSELNALVTAYASEVAAEGGIYNTDVLAAVERERIASGERIAADQNATNLSISKNNKPSYSGGGSSSSSSSSDFEKASILAGLYSMTEDAQTKADLLKQIAAIYGITLSEAKEIADNKGNNKNPIIPGNMKTGNIDSYLESIMGKNYILR